MTCIESLGPGPFFQGGFFPWPRLLETPYPHGVVQEISSGLGVGHWGQEQWGTLDRL